MALRLLLTRNGLFGAKENGGPDTLDRRLLYCPRLTSGSAFPSCYAETGEAEAKNDKRSRLRNLRSLLFCD
jgi:hypothetical protein